MCSHEDTGSHVTDLQYGGQPEPRDKNGAQHGGQPSAASSQAPVKTARLVRDVSFPFQSRLDVLIFHKTTVHNPRLLI